MSQRLFFKLHNGFPDHPKTVELSDKAFRHLVTLWCHCHRHETDGKVTPAVFKSITSAKTSRELTEIGFVEITETGYEMHGYLEDQQSKAQIEERARIRAMAGAKGGKAKANNAADAKQTPTKPLANTRSGVVPDVDIDRDKDEIPSGISSPPPPSPTLTSRDPEQKPAPREPSSKHRENLNTGRRIVNQFLETIPDTQFPSKLRNDLYVHAATLVQDGIDHGDIARGLEIWNGEGYPPSALHHSIRAAQRERMGQPPPGTARPRRATGTERAIQTLQLAEEIANEERAATRGAITDGSGLR